METIKELREYNGKRSEIRISSFGCQNTRISRFTIKELKGFLKQDITDGELRETIEKDIEFREVCYSLASVFRITT
jgi:hypothetical protein